MKKELECIISHIEKESFLETWRRHGTYVNKCRRVKLAKGYNDQYIIEDYPAYVKAVSRSIRREKVYLERMLEVLKESNN